MFEFVEKTLLEVLEERSGGLPQDLVRRYVYQLCRAIEWCHRNSVIHRDIKPENLLINPDHTLKLCDFGFARTVPVAVAGAGAEPVNLTDYVATRWYRAVSSAMWCDVMWCRVVLDIVATDGEGSPRLVHHPHIRSPSFYWAPMTTPWR